MSDKQITKPVKAMKVRYTRGETILHIVIVIICTLLSLAILLPMLNILFGAFSDPYDVMKHSGLFLYPINPTLYNFSLVFNNPSILTGYLNTIFVVVVGTGLNVLLSLIGAYVLSRKGARLVKFFTLMIVFTMYFQGGTIPSYLVVESLGLINSRWSMILPGAISTFNMIVMRTAMAQVPDSLPESAMIDGASHPQVLFRIMTPLCKATVAVIVLYYAVAHWNSGFSAFLYLRDKTKFPLQLILRQILFHEQHGCRVPGSGQRSGQVCNHRRCHRSDPHGLSVPSEVLREGRHGRSRQGLMQRV